MYIYRAEEINNEKVNFKNKPIIYSGQKYPYENLDDRMFEVLIYDLYKRHEIELKHNFDNILLMSGVAEHGRDAVMYAKGEVRAIIQCKHTSVNNRMEKSTAAKEIIKFVLYAIEDTELIPSNGEILYYFVNSNSFKEEAQILLDNFNERIIEEENLEIWANQVIKSYKKFKVKSYSEVKEKMISLFNRLKIQRVEREDIDVLISNQEDILSRFFQVRLVVEAKPRFPNNFEKLNPQKELAKDIYNNEVFVAKLKDIKIGFEHMRYAIIDYWRAIQTIDLFSNIDYLDLDVLVNYEEDLIRMYNNLYSLYCDKIKTNNEESLITLSRDFYLDIQNQPIIPLVGMEYNRPFFQNGIYQDIANSNDSVVWKLKQYKEVNYEQINFDDFY